MKPGPGENLKEQGFGCMVTLSIRSFPLSLSLPLTPSHPLPIPQSLQKGFSAFYESAKVKSEEEKIAVFKAAYDRGVRLFNTVFVFS